MPSEYEVTRPSRSILPTLFLLVMAFLLGCGAMTYGILNWEPLAGLLRPASNMLAPRTPPPVPSAGLKAQPAAAQANIDPALFDRLRNMEEQLRHTNGRIDSISGEAGRAEGLLIAFAVRRALDRGIPLGYLEGLLRDRFGGVDPQAVATVISAAHQPITLDQLRNELDLLRPALSVARADEGWWDGIRRELNGVIVVRQADEPSTVPIDRLKRAIAALENGHVDSALLEVSRLPARKSADRWITGARRYVQARAALDRIETAALLRPRDMVAVDR